MSENRAAHLRLEQQVNLLIAQVANLQLRVEELEQQREVQPFEFVSEPAPVSEAPAPSVVAHPIVSESTTPTIDPNRRAILRQIGGWIRSCLEGRRRGLSGRERLYEGNRYYLVFRNYHSRLFDPVLICDSFVAASREVKPRGSCGDSVFVGVPSLADGEVVVAAAGVAWPHRD